MATNIVLAYDVNDTVYHVDITSGVREGVVKTSSAVIKPTGTTLSYSVQFVVAANGAIVADEADLFDDLDLALAEYKTRILAL